MYHFTGQWFLGSNKMALPEHALPLLGIAHLSQVILHLYRTVMITYM